MNPPGSDDVEASGLDQPGVMIGGAPAPVGACGMPSAPGTVLGRVQLPARAGGALVSTNAAGEVAFTSNVIVGSDFDGQPIYAPGITKLDANLVKVYEYLHGDVVALDSMGNAYVAGGFTTPTNFGLGVIEPMGNIDVFLVKLSPTGEVLSAEALGLCGDGVVSIALGPNGRIAISGTGTGTVVLDASGAIAFQNNAVGKLAFDKAGNLAIGGVFMGNLDLGGGHVLAAAGSDDRDGFVAKLDPGGNVLFARRFGDTTLPILVNGFGGPVLVTTPQAQAVADVAVGPDGSVAAVGAFHLEMDLNGTPIVSGSSFPSGSVAGSFVIKLGPTGAPVFALQGFPVNAGIAFGGTRVGAAGFAENLVGNAVTVTGTGDVVTSMNTPGNAQPPFSYPQLTEYESTTGAVKLSIGNFTGPVGYGLGLGVDGCNNLIWASFLNVPNIFDPHTFFAKLAL